MGDYNAKPVQITFLLPAEIKLSKRYNVRPFEGGNSKVEDERIEKLAESIETCGQLDDAIIDPGSYLIAGHRRMRAIILINERRGANFGSLVKLRCRIDDTGGDMRQKAIISNLQRSDRSPMDLCYLIYAIRQENGWLGPANTVKVAKYLAMDRNVVTQHECLMRLEMGLQRNLHDGVISMQTANDLRKAIPDPVERASIIARAAVIQQEDRTEKVLDDYHAGRKNLTESTRVLQSAPRIRIEHPAVIKAMRERQTPERNNLPLSRTELIRSISQLDVEGLPDKLRDFARYWSQEFAAGHGDQEGVLSRFRAVA